MSLPEIKEALKSIVNATDLQMQDGDYARDVARKMLCILNETKESMNIQELKAARDQLEKELLEAIDVRIDAFKQHSGVMVESVSVDFRSVSVVGGDRESFVNGVRVGLTL